MDDHLPSTLAGLAMDAVLPALQGLPPPWEGRTSPLDDFARDTVEELMEHAWTLGEPWQSYWVFLLTPRLKNLILPFNKRLLSLAKKRCKGAKTMLCTGGEGCKLGRGLLEELPQGLEVLDLDGSLFFRGRPLPGEPPLSWLPQATWLLKSLRLSRWRRTRPEAGGLVEIDLGPLSAEPRELAAILQSCPALRLLRHYQMASALLLLPEDTKPLRLTNIDADFSHVGGRGLSGDGLRTAARLCPLAEEVRLRYDVTTCHDATDPLQPLGLRSLSAVCVTTGERTLLDFTDLAPLLSNTLQRLELKVVEEVDPHAIVRKCKNLEELTLSGCGYAAGPTASCPAAGCSAPSFALPRLRSLFYADGDDFSWDHHLPQCFWRAALSPGCRVEGVVLESPRMSEESVGRSLKRLPCLKVLSLCRMPEVRVEHLLLAAPTQFLGVSSCEAVPPDAAPALRDALPGAHVRVD